MPPGGRGRCWSKAPSRMAARVVAARHSGEAVVGEVVVEAAVVVGGVVVRACTRARPRRGTRGCWPTARPVVRSAQGRPLSPDRPPPAPDREGHGHHGEGGPGQVEPDDGVVGDHLDRRPPAPGAGAPIRVPLTAPTVTRNTIRETARRPATVASGVGPEQPDRGGGARRSASQLSVAEAGQGLGHDHVEGVGWGVLAVEQAGPAVVAQVGQEVDVAVGEQPPPLHGREHRAQPLAVAAGVADGEQPVGLGGEGRAVPGPFGRVCSRRRFRSDRHGAGLSIVSGRSGGRTHPRTGRRRLRLRPRGERAGGRRPGDPAEDRADGHAQPGQVATCPGCCRP